MAITWTVNITNVDVGSKRADVSFTGIDDVNGIITVPTTSIFVAIEFPEPSNTSTTSS